MKENNILEVLSYPALKLHDLLQKKELSSEELTKAVLTKIEQTDKQLGAFLTVTREQAIQQARTVDEKLSHGDLLPSPLAGSPIAIKDNMCTRGIRTTCGYARNGLPIGFQILTPAFREETILKMAYAYEQSDGYELRLPTAFVKAG